MQKDFYVLSEKLDFSNNSVSLNIEWPVLDFGQMVTAGKGIFQIGVDSMSRVTITGFDCHFI